MLSFDEIISQKKIIAYFRKAIANDKLSHSYIISGNSGMGKKSIANAFALELMCNSIDNKPCLCCKACKQIIAGTNVDLIYIKHEKPKLISINEIRQQLIQSAYIRPINSKYKIYIVDEAETLSIEAQNALLKIIEEAPEYIIIILLTNNLEAFLDTIKSRCVKLNMEYIKKIDIANYLKNKYKLSDNKLEEITSFAGGNLGKAIVLCTDEEKIYFYEKIIEILKNINKLSSYKSFEYLEILKDNKDNLLTFIEISNMWYRDILLIKSSKKSAQRDRLDKLIFKKEYTSLLELAGLYTFSKINKLIELLGEAGEKIKANVNIEILSFILLDEMRIY